MKKLLCTLLSLVLLCCLTLPVYAEEIDLSVLTWDELLDLKAQITMEQLTRDEWQEVDVPQGVYKVGEDIPAGKWTIKSIGSRRWCNIEIGDKLADNGNELDMWGNNVSYYIYNPEHPNFEIGDCTETVVTLRDGYYVEIDNYGNHALFCTYTGKNLGFK